MDSSGPPERSLIKTILFELASEFSRKIELIGDILSHIYIYRHTHTHMGIYIHRYTHVYVPKYRQRDRKTQRETERIYYKELVTQL